MSGGLRYPKQPIRFSQSEQPVPTRAPRLGEHTRQLLREAGVSAAEIEAAMEVGA